MTKLEELINELCPDGVEYKPLEECCIILDKQRKPVTKAARQKGEYRYYGANGIQDYVSDYIFDGTFVLVGEDGSVMTSNGKPIVNWAEGKIWVNNHAHIIAEKEGTSLRYLYHLLQTIDVRNLIHGNIPKLTQGDFKSLQIPLPPLSIQSEIVHILDSFTLLTAELTAELTARQKQYAFYRDYLLDFSNEDVTKKIPDIDCSNVEYKRLGDVATAIYRGAGIKRDEVTEMGIPCVRYGEIYTTYNVTFNNCVSHTDEDKIQNKKYFEHGDVLFAITGESVEEIAKSCVYLGHDKCLAGGDIVVLKHNQNPKYMAYVLSTTNAQSQKSKGKVKSKVVHSSVPAISDIIIPIPPLAEQEKIANMIERFDRLCNDISNGLPAEIEARKKQYEYYRDTLLSFDDKACSHIVKVERERELTRSKAIKWLKLGEIGKVRMCKRILKSQTNTQFGVPFYKIGTFGKKADSYVSNELFNEYKSKYSYPKKGDILISCSGTIGRTVVFNGEPAYFQDSNIVWLENDESVVLNTYLKYCYDRQPWRAESGGTIARLYNANIENAVIPVPPLEEQERIVSILDRFDKLCNDISEGLPAEIEARQKQYEYYRDKLLTFKITN